MIDSAIFHSRKFHMTFKNYVFIGFISFHSVYILCFTVRDRYGIHADMFVDVCGYMDMVEIMCQR